MKRIIIGAVLSCITSLALAKNDIAYRFIENVKSAADGDEVLSENVTIDCPAKSGSGRILITKASYEYGNSKGAFIFKNPNDSEAIMTSLATKLHNDDFTSDEVDGFEFGFKMPSGQFFVTVMKDGNATVGANVNGTSGVTEIKCKVVGPQ